MATEADGESSYRQRSVGGSGTLTVVQLAAAGRPAVDIICDQWSVKVRTLRG